MTAVKEKFSDILFFIFYVSLFTFQVLPSWAAAFMEITSVWFWAFCFVGLAAMIVQTIKFPCFNVRIWNSGMIALFIVSFFMKG